LRRRRLRSHSISAPSQAKAAGRRSKRASLRERAEARNQKPDAGILISGFLDSDFLDSVSYLPLVGRSDDAPSSMRYRLAT
jgi:hypothetical protein